MKKAKPINVDALERLERWCEKNQKLIIGAILLVFSFMSMVLFNLRVSEGGDDSTYIIRALEFVKEGKYPSFQGPVYPVFLSIFVAIFGIKLGALKISSFLVMLASVWVFYIKFRNRISYTLLFTTLFITSISSYYIYFTSQTYSEGLFILLQLPIFALIFSDIESEDKAINWKRLLLLSAVVLLGYLTRTIGIAALVAVLFYFLVDKRFKEAGIVLGAFVVMLLLFMVLKNAIWQNGFFESGQASTLMYKHPYQMDKGKETFVGFLGRFVDNSNLYLSKHFMKFVGLKSAATIKLNGWITLLLYGIFGFGAFAAFKKNKYVFFIAIYAAVMLGLTFLVLQKLWDQYRLIIPYFPYMLIVLLYGLHQLVVQQKSKFAKYAFIVLIGASVMGTFSQTFAKVDMRTLRKNLNGDRYEGYTDDWRHFLSMTEHAAKSLPEDAFVAVRKPNMARIYGNGKKFYGIYRFDTTDPDALLKRLKDKNVSHVIMGSLRKNPKVNNGQTINTIQRYLYLISQKYPQIFKMEFQIGKSEPAYLLKVDYDAVKFVNPDYSKNQNTKK